jgi:hypothetical protein
MKLFDLLLGAVLVAGAFGLSVFLGLTEMRGESMPMLLEGVPMSAAGPMICVVMSILGMKVLSTVSLKD